MAFGDKAPEVMTVVVEIPWGCSRFYQNFESGDRNVKETLSRSARPINGHDNSRRLRACRSTGSTNERSGCYRSTGSANDRSGCHRCTGSTNDRSR